MELNVQVTEDLVIGVDMPPGAPPLGGLTLDFRPVGEELLRLMIGQLGGVDAFHFDPSSNLSARYAVPVTCDGEKVTTATLHVWFDPADTTEPVVKYPAIKRLADEQSELRRRELSHG